MSIVVVPGQFRGEAHPAGKLASTLLSVTVAGMADPQRFRRGKTYLSEHAVSRLDVKPGLLLATVAGSRAHPYQVAVGVHVVPRIEVSPEGLRNQLTRLTPEAGELMVSCTCPDDDDPCKHAVAALLAFAHELVSRPELLVQWRCSPSDEVPERPRVGSRARSERHLRLAPPIVEARPEPASPWESPEWQQFLGEFPPQPPSVPDEAAKVGRAMSGSVDLAAMARSALDTLRADR